MRRKQQPPLPKTKRKEEKSKTVQRDPLLIEDENEGASSSIYLIFIPN